jgi:hypothetical protein
VSNNRYGDYISIGKGRLVIKNLSTLDFSNDSRVNYPITLAENTFPTGTKVEFSELSLIILKSTKDT